VTVANDKAKRGAALRPGSGRVGRRCSAGSASRRSASSSRRRRVKIDERFRQRPGDLCHRSTSWARADARHKAQESIALAELLAGKPGHVNYDPSKRDLHRAELAMVAAPRPSSRKPGSPSRPGASCSGRTVAPRASACSTAMSRSWPTRRPTRSSASTWSAAGLRAHRRGGAGGRVQGLAEDIALTSHAHPTCPSGAQAALAVGKRALHSYPRPLPRPLRFRAGLWPPSRGSRPLVSRRLITASRHGDL